MDSFDTIVAMNDDPQKLLFLSRLLLVISSRSMGSTKKRPSRECYVVVIEHDSGLIGKSIGGRQKQQAMTTHFAG